MSGNHYSSYIIMFWRTSPLYGYFRTFVRWSPATLDKCQQHNVKIWQLHLQHYHLKPMYYLSLSLNIQSLLHSSRHHYSVSEGAPTLTTSSFDLFLQTSSPLSNILISIHTLLWWFGTMLFYWGSDLTLECQNQPFLQPISSGPHPSPRCLGDTRR